MAKKHCPTPFMRSATARPWNTRVCKCVALARVTRRFSERTFASHYVGRWTKWSSSLSLLIDRPRHHNPSSKMILASFIRNVKHQLYLIREWLDAPLTTCEKPINTIIKQSRQRYDNAVVKLFFLRSVVSLHDHCANVCCDLTNPRVLSREFALLG